MLTKRLPVQFDAQVCSVVTVAFKAKLALQPKQEFGRADEVFACAPGYGRGMDECVEVVTEVQGHLRANLRKKPGRILGISIAFIWFYPLKKDTSTRL